MAYRFEEIKDGNFWNSFVKKYEHINIMSSWEWIELEKSLGFDVFPYGMYEESVLKGVFAFRIVDAKRGKYLILKQNAFFDWKNKELFKSFVDFLKVKSKEFSCSFFRISPSFLDSKENRVLFVNHGFKMATIHPIDAQVTLILDLTKSLDEISENMRKNTRYSIRRGERMGLEVLNTKGMEYMDEFRKIYEMTVKRHGWNASDFEYIENQYKFFSSQGISRMFCVKYKGKILGAAIFTQFADQVIYHHSGSVTDMQNVPAMYLLIWEAIKYYKKIGLKGFNFFGVCSKTQKAHPWYGLSLFKRGFGGSEKKLMHSYDYPITCRYYVTRIFEYFERLSIKH
jgi:lipid II:glycine glycyltransferase (peptidoglycan interpeptide bridge formation enzyme)